MQLVGRLVLEDEVRPGRLRIEGGRIVEVAAEAAGVGGPLLAPGFIDLHVHGWGGHDAMGDADALDGMARALRVHGVTSFVPTAVTAPLPALRAWADGVRAWMERAPADGATPLGFGMEGPFLSPERRGAQAERHLLAPAAVPLSELEPLLDRLCLIHLAPELPGALDVIRWLVQRGVVVSLAHSAATLGEAQAGYAAGATSTTHLFNAMSGVAHRDPGLAVAALADDAVAVELIADGQHVHPALWRIVARSKPPSRLLLVSDAISLAGTGDGRATLGALEVEVRAGRATLAGTDTLAGSVIALDSAVRNLVESGIALPAAIRAASTNPAQLLGLSDRGRIADGMRADLVELDDELRVVGVIHAGRRAT
jgi:N-acetylglucosamine-6-phosphate deacetylase